MATHESLSLSVLILAINEGANLRVLLPQLKGYLGKVSNEFEVVVVDGGSKDDTVSVATSLGCRVISQSQPGYGQAFRDGLAACTRPFILTLDADLSHPAWYIEQMITLIRDYDIIIASRYTSGGGCEMPRHRVVLSKILNLITRTLFGLPLADVSSGYRLYRADFIKQFQLQGRNFDVLIEVLVKAERSGGRLVEVPFHYRNRESGISKARLISFGMAYFRTLVQLKAGL